ncbi:MAG: nucleotidyltransferase family protein [Betaproteobacteria bacterium]|nr:nucleotidyltransferase family protein [Betaproteobacteria bacterium]
MNRNQTLQLLTLHKPELTRRFGVVQLALFGSSARDEAHVGSDVDVLVSFDGPATSHRYFGVQFYLEDIFGRPVDLVTDKALRAELRPYVERESIRV